MYACSHCGAEVADSEVDAELGLFQCSLCEEVSTLESAVATAPDPVRFEEPPALPARSGPPPAGWEIEAGTGLGLILVWRSWGLIPNALFTMVWCGFLTAFAISGSWFVLLLPHGWVGLFMLYNLVANLFNTSRIAVEGPDLVIAHGPVPWPGNRRIPVEDLEQIWVEKSMMKVNKRSRWNLRARVRGGNLTLMRLFEDPDAAQWIERHLEQELGIHDEPVSGEVSKS